MSNSLSLVKLLGDGGISLLRILKTAVLDDTDIELYVDGRVYNTGDRIFHVGSDGKGKILKCIVDGTTGPFDINNWIVSSANEELTKLVDKVNDYIAKTDKTLNRVDVTKTLKHGTNVITSDQSALINTIVYGATQTSLLASKGNFEDPNDWSKAFCTLEVGNNPKYGNSSLLARSADSGSAMLIRSRNAIPINNQKYYVGIVEVFNVDSSSVHLRITHSNLTDGLKTGATNNKTGSYQTHIVKLAPHEMVGVDAVYFDIVSPFSNPGSVIHIDGGGLFEVEKDIYDRVNIDITASNIREYLPHVDGKQHVNGIVITKQGLNLLPEKPEFIHSVAKYNGPYNLTVDATAADQTSYFVIPALPKRTYTLKVETTGANGTASIYSYDASGFGTYLGSASPDNPTLTVETLPDAVYIRVNLGAVGAGKISFKNWILVHGDNKNLPPEFEPSHKQHQAIPAVLGRVGETRDEVRVDGTSAIVVNRIRKAYAIHGKMTGADWSATLQTDYAEMYIDLVAVPEAKQTSGEFNMIKYDGTVLRATSYGNFLGADYIGSGATGIVITVPLAVTGWVAGVAPNISAANALMNGWKASSNDGSKYTGWVSILTGEVAPTNTEAYVKANLAPGWTGWGVMDYAMNTAEISSVRSDGAITLHEGFNEIRVETGVLVREKVAPVYNNSTKQWDINTSTLSNPLLRRTKDILQVYRESEVDNAWIIKKDYATGLATASIPAKEHNSKQSYYITRIINDKYGMTTNAPKTDIQYKAGLSAIIGDAVQSIADLRAEDDRLSFAADYIQAHLEDLAKTVDDLNITVLPDDSFVPLSNVNDIPEGVTVFAVTVAGTMGTWNNSVGTVLSEPVAMVTTEKVVAEADGALFIKQTAHLTTGIDYIRQYRNSWSYWTTNVSNRDIVTTATANKILKLDANAELPATAASAKTLGSLTPADVFVSKTYHGGLDLNNLIVPGIYSCQDNSINKPETAWGSVVVGYISHSMWIQQFWMGQFGNLYFRYCTDSNSTRAWTRWTRIMKQGATDNANGFFDFSTTAPTGNQRLNYSGDFYATRVFNASYNDYAEYFERNDRTIEPGDVVSLDPNSDEEIYVKSSGLFDPYVVGVVSDDYAQCIGGNGDGNDEENFCSVGLAGRVRVKVTGRVRKGDLLVASHIPGVAREGNRPGCVIAKALQSHEGDGVDRIRAIILNA